MEQRPGFNMNQNSSLPLPSFSSSFNQPPAWDFSQPELALLNAQDNPTSIFSSTPTVDNNDDYAFYRNRPPPPPLPATPFAQPLATAPPLPSTSFQVPRTAVEQPWTAAPSVNSGTPQRVLTRPLAPVESVTRTQSATPAASVSAPGGSTPSVDRDGFEIIDSTPADTSTAPSKSQGRKRAQTTQPKDAPAPKKAATSSEDTRQTRRGGQKGRSKFRSNEDSCLLDFYEKYLPAGNMVLEELPAWMEQKGHAKRTVASYKRRFDVLAHHTKPTGNPEMAPNIRRAKDIDLRIGNKTGILQLNDDDMFEEDDNEDAEDDDEDDDLYASPEPAPPIPAKAKAAMAAESARSPSVPVKRELSASLSDAPKARSRATSAALLSGILGALDPKASEERRAAKQAAAADRDERRSLARADRDEVRYLREQLTHTQVRFDNLFAKYENVKKERDDLQNKVNKLEIKLMLAESSRARRKRSPSSSRSRSRGRRSRSPSRSRTKHGYDTPRRRRSKSRSRGRKRSRSASRRSRSPRRHRHRSPSAHGEIFAHDVDGDAEPLVFTTPSKGQGGHLVLEHRISVTPQHPQLS